MDCQMDATVGWFLSHLITDFICMYMAVATDGWCSHPILLLLLLLLLLSNFISRPRSSIGFFFFLIVLLIFI